MASNDDFELWQRIQKNDFSAYEIIYSKYLPIIFSVVFKHIGNREEAEDITQEVFLSIWEKKATIRLEGKLFSYIYGTARYKVFKYLRDQKRTAKHEAGWSQWVNDKILRQDAEEPAEFTDNEEAALLKIRSEATKLPPRMRMIYELNMEQQLHAAEIAEQLDISEHTVKKHLTNIRKRLRNAAVMLFFVVIALPILPNR